MATSSQYGVTNPSGIDPFPIEQTLAQIVGTNNPAAARDMLNTYQVKNMVSQDNYDYDLNQQHEYAKQQLQATIAENQMRAALEGVKTRGGTSVVAAMDPSIRARIGSLIPSIEGGLTNLQNAKVLQESGAGAYSAAQAGRDITDEQAARASGGLLGPQGVPLSTRNELLKEAGANARAATTAAGDKTSVQMPADPSFPGAVITEKPRKGETYQGFRDRMIAEGRVPGQVQLPSIPGKTNVPPAPGATSAPPASRVQGTSPGADPVQKAVNDHIENVVRTKDPAAYKDIMTQAQKNGGRPQLLRDSKGNVVGVQGATQQWR